MPPKKNTRASNPLPSIIKSKNGKEYETTAAATRPKRETVAPSTSVPAPQKKSSASKTATSTTGKKRGRPAKAAVEEEPPKKRGRPAKAASVEEEPPKKRGRPSKAAAATTDEVETPKRGPGRPPKQAAGKKRGRPAKAQTSEEEAPPKKRGRASKATVTEAPAVPEDETAPPKKRGRPPFGGETTKLDGDDEAAAEQLEEELQDQTEVLEESTPRKRKAPTKAKGKGKAKQQDVEQDAQPTSGKNYWLMKAEQEDRDETLKSGRVFNTKFTIDDLRSKTQPEPWDGVRNPTAAKNMRAMKQGDLAFFYASGGKRGRKPGIVGIMEIVKEHEPDPTAHDEDAIGFVEDEDKRDRWCVVHVEYRNKLTKPVFLSELQKFAKEGGALNAMQELNAARLSVSRVSEAEWNFITENLIEGYEEDEGDAVAGAEAADADMPAGQPTEPTTIEEDSTLNITEQADGSVILEKPTVEKDNELPDPVQGLMESTEAADLEPPTTDTLMPDATSATGRATSRASSRKSSRAPSISSRPGSRAGSLAPSSTFRARGRSRTPKVRAGSAGPKPAIVEEEAVAMQSIIEEPDSALA